MNKEDICLTCPKPKWVAFALESEGHEPGPKKMPDANWLFHFTPALKNGQEEIKLFDSLAWAGPGGAGQKEPGQPKRFTTLAEEVRIYLGVSPDYVKISCIKTG